VIWVSLYDGAFHGPGLHQHHRATICCGSSHAVLQGDGNFVIYNEDYSIAAWSSSSRKAHQAIHREKHVSVQRIGLIAFLITYREGGDLQIARFGPTRFTV
jgi:hypothetical protein